jgi:hypothetical protein
VVDRVLLLRPELLLSDRELVSALLDADSEVVEALVEVARLVDVLFVVKFRGGKPPLPVAKGNIVLVVPLVIGKGGGEVVVASMVVPDDVFAVKNIPPDSVALVDVIEESRVLLVRVGDGLELELPDVVETKGKSPEVLSPVELEVEVIVLDDAPEVDVRELDSPAVELRDVEDVLWPLVVLENDSELDNPTLLVLGERESCPDGLDSVEVARVLENAALRLVVLT